MSVRVPRIVSHGQTYVKSPVASLCLTCSSLRYLVKVTMSVLIFSCAAGGGPFDMVLVLCWSSSTFRTVLSAGLKVSMSVTMAAARLKFFRLGCYFGTDTSMISEVESTWALAVEDHDQRVCVGCLV